MPKTRTPLVCAAIALLTGVVLGAPTAEDFVRFNLPITAIRAEGVQPADRPILVTVVLTNTGDKPISLGPTPYSGLNGLEPTVTDARGKTYEAGLYNSDPVGGSGGFRPLPPGQTVDVPALLAPLPVGTYTIQVGKAKAVQVTVNEDPELARRRAQEIHDRVRRGDDVFALYLFRHYPDPAVTDALVQDLLSDDGRVAGKAAWGLTRLRTLPREAGPAVCKAMEKHLGLRGQQRDRNTGVLTPLGFLAGKIGTDDTLEAVLALARSDMGSATRSDAMVALGGFQQEKGVQALRDFLKDPDERVRFYAARVLAKRKDAAALPVLLEITRDKQNTWLRYAYEALANYRDDPRAKAALQEGGQPVAPANFGWWSGGLSGPGLLLRNRLVQEDLGLTEEQVKKVQEITEQTSKGWEDRFAKMSPAEHDQLGKVQAAQEELHAEEQKALARVLSPEQVKRLWQINLQAQGLGALSMPEVREKIKLTAEQEREIERISRDGNQEANDIVDGSQRSTSDTDKRLRAVSKATREKILGVLTDEQKEAWKEIIGKPFDFQREANKNGR